ncbi:TRAP transporter small permease [candidate division KSB1 bacterium]|nr:TRAP transporter small permease [candidate division KSB1 bacterium]
MTVMVVDVVWQVFSRFVLQQSSSITEELATYLLIWIGLLGGAYALHERAHLGIDLITNRLSEKGKVYSEIITFCVVMVVAVVVFIIGGFRLLYITITLNQISPALQIKVGYFYSVIPLTGLLFVFYSSSAIYNSVVKLKS